MTRHRPKGKGKRDDRSDLIEKTDMKNERLFAYYKAQKIVPENEWDAFVDALRQHLPTTFRVSGSRQTANTLNGLLKDIHVPALSDVTFEGQKIPPPVQIPWYPDGLAWQFNVPKKVLRKSPEFKKFHSFLVFETEVGNISRQEAVSMLPPLFLEVEPHHRVMDMCAAPGSKTAQILEALHSQDTVTSSSIPSGLLLANDSDHKRTHLLIHQSARLPSPALMVTNLDASNYPSIRIPVTRNGKKVLEPLLFDRILCDVPCSGDGTIRKNMGIWKSWGPMDGNGLHSLQLRILLRAMRLLKTDGRIVYSTCSLNPVENEAVIAEALALNRSFELIDVASMFSPLIRRPGLTTWRPTADRTCARTFESYEEFMGSSVDESTKAKLTKGHWPPNDAESLNLHRCMRIYPHLQDSGGFFIAVLHKTTPKTDIERKRGADGPVDLPESKKLRLDDLPAKIADDIMITEISQDEAGQSASALESEAYILNAALPAVVSKFPKHQESDRVGNGSFRENPYTYLAEDDLNLVSCIERLHIIPDFPSSNILVRNPEGEAARSLYLSNDIVKAIILHNNYERIRLTTAGTKVFAKQEGGKGAEAQFRVLGEGLPVVLPYIDPRTIIEGDMASMRVLVESYYPLCSRFPDSFKQAIEARATGGHIVRFPKGTVDGVCLPHDLVLPIWKSNVSLTLMIDKKAKSALSLRLFGADITTAGKETSTAHRQKEAEKESFP